MLYFRYFWEVYPMAIFLMFIASVFVSLANYSMRRSIDSGGTTKVFLVFQMTTAFIVAIFLNPIRTGRYEINLPILLLGAFSGLVLATFLFSLGRALEKGPPGFTFSILNASTVVPGIAMAFLFGSLMGFPYTAWHGIGSILVVAGLFWAGKGLDGLQDKKGWSLFALSMFSLHALLLIIFQWRALLLNSAHPEQIFSSFTGETIQSQWFMPSMFLTSAIFQLILFLRFERRAPFQKEILYGVVGGVANSLCTYFMIWSTEVANPLENAVIFPIFSVVTIIFSNLWGQKLYQEKVNWRACQLCAFGLIVGTVDWRGVAAFIGF